MWAHCKKIQLSKSSTNKCVKGFLVGEVRLIFCVNQVKIHVLPTKVLFTLLLKYLFTAVTAHNHFKAG